MADKKLDSEVLAALHLLSAGTEVNYMAFVRTDTLGGALDLIDRGYAARIRLPGDDANYVLTSLGKSYLERILQFASQQYDIK